MEKEIESQKKNKFVNIAIFALAFIALGYWLYTSWQRSAVSDELFIESAMQTNRLCPQEIEPGVVLTQCVFEDGKFVYQYQLTHSSLEGVDLNGFKKQLAETIPTMDKSFTDLLRKLAHSSDMLHYLYHEANVRWRDLVFSSAESQHLAT